MKFFQFSFLDFFGILAPGILFLINILVLFYSLGELLSPIGLNFSEIISNENISLLQSSGGGIVLSLVLIVFSYFFGFILRLISPDIVDKVAGYYRKIISPRKELFAKLKLMKVIENDVRLGKNDSEEHQDTKLSFKKRCDQFNKYLKKTYYPQIVDNKGTLPLFFWSDENYPYYWGIKYVYIKHFPKELYSELMNTLNFHNKNIYNFFKELAAAKDQNIFSLISQAEAYVRLMCGSFWSLLLGLGAGILLILSQLLRNGYEFNLQMNLGLSMILLSIFTLHIIITRFKNQRRREVKMLLDGIMIISNSQPIVEYCLSKMGQSVGEE